MIKYQSLFKQLLELESEYINLNERFNSFQSEYKIIKLAQKSSFKDKIGKTNMIKI